jgi:hypothetical protein
LSSKLKSGGSIPPCTSANYPDCLKNQRTATGRYIIDTYGEPKHTPYDLDPKLDSNIVDSHTNLENTEKKLGKPLKLGLADKKKSSDPPHNSADGHETRHYKGEGEDDSVKYKTDQPLDHDIITTHKNLKAAEKTAGEKPQAKDADKGKEK